MDWVYENGPRTNSAWAWPLCHIQVERHAAQQEAEVQQLVAVQNDQPGQQLEDLAEDGTRNEQRTSEPGRGSDTEELELLRRKNSEQNRLLEKLKADLQRATICCSREQKERREKEEEIVRLTRNVKRLEDVALAAQQIAVETQLRQLDELQWLTKENNELKQILARQYRQQQRPTTDQHHQGNAQYTPPTPTRLSCRVASASAV